MFISMSTWCWKKWKRRLMDTVNKKSVYLPTTLVRTSYQKIFFKWQTECTLQRGDWDHKHVCLNIKALCPYFQFQFSFEPSVRCIHQKIKVSQPGRDWLVFNAIFCNISAISWVQSGRENRDSNMFSVISLDIVAI